MADQGLFEVFTTTLKDEELKMRMATTDIMVFSMTHSPSLLRAFLARQKPDYPLLRLIFQKFTEDPELGVKSQCAEILKLLILTEEGPAEEVCPMTPPQMSILVARFFHEFSGVHFFVEPERSFDFFAIFIE